MVLGFGMGAIGVGIATSFAQYAAATMILIYMCRYDGLCKINLREVRLKKEDIKSVVRNGLPAGLQSVVFSISNVLIQSTINSYGDAVIAGSAAAGNIEGFIYIAMNSLYQTAMTFAGQNVGAGRYDRVSKGAKQGTLMAVICSTVITGVILIFGKHLMGVFTETEELVTLAAGLMMILAVGYIAMAVTQSLSGIMRGAGDTMTPMWISLITTVAARVPLAYGISYLTRTEELPYGNSDCIPVSLLITWVLGAILTAIFYKIGKWKKKAIM
jgi:putative MATE family efflux protein